jgi:hypothetical protein
MSHELRRYLDLEQAMLELDAYGNPFADEVRDVMDDAWRDLSDADRDWINARSLPPRGNQLRLVLGDKLFVSPPSTSPQQGVVWTNITDWRSSAA